MGRAAIYLRSSKDRHDVSISAQRHELQKLATAKKLTIVAEFEDVVLSGKDENRPGFQALMQALNVPGRSWDHLLILDTSRLSRARYVGEVFCYQAEKRGVRILYAKVPDQLDPITEIIVTSMLRAMDVVHSMMSREKGLAGMAENLRLGYRPAGAAPYGYKLRKIETGAVREGTPVTKSVLEPDEHAPVIGRYLKLRAAQVPRAMAKAQCAVRLADTTLIGIEWNALTYAGHTTFHKHNERSGAGYKGARKRRPRSEWKIQRNTHPAVITDEEAESILSRLEVTAAKSAADMSTAKRCMSSYMLSGLLVTPDGRTWSGEEGKYYRIPREGRRGLYVSAEDMEKAVLDQLLGDMSSDRFIDSVVQWARNSAAIRVSPLADIRRRLTEISAQIDRAMDLSLKLTSPAPALRKVDALEAERASLVRELERMSAEQEHSNALAKITPEAVRDLLAGLSEDIADRDPGQVKLMLRSFLDRVVLDPDTMDCEIHYRLRSKTPLSMALLPGFEPGFKP